MSQFYEILNPKLIDFIREQPIYFVASAAAGSRINCSPKGMNTLRVLNEKTVAYLDLTGSGSETSAHIINDGRLTIMFCSFTEKPLILRLYGRGEVVHENDPQWADLISHFTQLPGQRQIIVLHVESVQTSCGFAVPRMQLIETREMLVEWAEKKGDDGLADYRAQKNRVSIDGLQTGLPVDASSKSPHT
ncbi:MAG TPA: pyridoxamine 5'-phosphate oxidase family protein [Tepidisphaeraceae bacterium]|nr:pyridoxamine 5'-phosphate oxidase family protein [Tepidisphaeraceae bacterium]